MNSKDFRIGNLIDRQDYICQVIKIDKEGIITEPLNYKGERFVMQTIKPIQLTRGWLIKLGFEIEQLNKAYSIKISDFYELWGYEENDKWNTVDEFVLFVNGSEYDTPTKINYVHQLQNLYYALVGRDLAVAPPCP